MCCNNFKNRKRRDRRWELGTSKEDSYQRTVAEAGRNMVNPRD
jgi:hypothetical protein